MRIPLELAFKGVEPTAAMEELVREQVERLQRFEPRILACRVTVESTHRASNAAPRGVRVNVEVSVPGQRLVSSRERGGLQKPVEYDPYRAIRRAFIAAERQIKEASDQRQHPWQ